MKNLFSAFILHLHPRTVSRETTRFTLSFGLGGMAATLILVMAASGLLQLIQYRPTIDGAYFSIGRMYTMGGVGGLIRNIHYWAGNLLVIVAVLHLMRVLFTGAVSGARRMNWLVGICLLLVVLAANFTGYLLPWDQLAYWAVTIFTNMIASIPVVGEHLALTLRGGREVGPATLSNFFALHVGIMPVLLLTLLICHFWLVRKAGGLVVRQGRPVDRVSVMPHLIMKELGTALLLVAALTVVAALVDAPLGDPANPGESPNPVKAAWYFMGLQELLLHLHPAFAVFVVPLFALAGLAAVPFIRDAGLAEGVWFGGRKGALLACSAFLISLVLTFLTVWVDEVLLRPHYPGGAYNLALFRGVLPVGGFFLVLIAGYFGLQKKGGYSRAECVMAAAVTGMAIVAGLTIVGIWFRGKGMHLVWLTQ